MITHFAFLQFDLVILVVMIASAMQQPGSTLDDPGSEALQDRNREIGQELPDRFDPVVGSDPKDEKAE
jgi:hypothetical protein